jgi:hypothetical protein
MSSPQTGDRSWEIGASAAEGMDALRVFEAELVSDLGGANQVAQLDRQVRVESG